MSGEEPPKSRLAYILLGLFLGEFGVHNFYAGSMVQGLIQLLITVLSCGALAIIAWVWAIIEIITVTKDAQGVTFTS